VIRKDSAELVKEGVFYYSPIKPFTSGRLAAMNHFSQFLIGVSPILIIMFGTLIAAAYVIRRRKNEKK
jgi:hypothetical protein|tara:strand:- start:69 stop:272 length:204 start_codon:yes stop_codon:yes gene_type:complete